MQEKVNALQKQLDEERVSHDMQVKELLEKVSYLEMQKDRAELMQDKVNVLQNQLDEERASHDTQVKDLLEKMTYLQIEKGRAQLEAQVNKNLVQKLDEHHKAEIAFLDRALEEKDNTIYQYHEQLETANECIEAILNELEWYRAQSCQDASFVENKGGHEICVDQRPNLDLVKEI